MRLAIVTPWYGRELLGGAERQAWELAHALARNGVEVEVLTTCARSFFDDWAANFHRSGVARDAAGVTVRRFAVDSRDRAAFNRINTVLTTVPRVGLRGDRVVLDPAGARAFVDHNVNSRALLAHLASNGAAYDAVLFLPYLYGTTVRGVPLVAERAFLIPCLHDEAYAYLAPVRATFAAARGVFFNSAGEQETAAAIYGPGVLAKSRVTGEAVEPIVPPAKPLAAGAFVPQRSRYVLYLGRQDRSKNVDFLIEAFRAFRARRASTSLQLVLAGPRGAARSGDGVVDLGAVDEPRKAALLAYARALAQPSLHESFSRAMYEAWSVRRPVLVHGACRATARAVEDSGGGWIGTTLEDWVRMLATVDESSDEAVAAAGERGWAAAVDNGTWDDVARRTVDAIRARLAPPAGPRVENLVPLGDAAAGRCAQALAAALSAAGAPSGVAIAGSATAPADAYVVHDGTVARLEAPGIAPRVLPEPVDPAVWDGVQPADERWAGAPHALLAIGTVDARAARRLLEVFVALLGRLREARLLVFAADCDAAALALLQRERTELDLSADVVLVGERVEERYAAYRAATAALALGPVTLEAAVMPLWFDVPVVALETAALPDAIAASGIVVEAFDARRVAALLRVVATGDGLRAAIAAEGRRVRARHAPAAVAAAVLETLARTPRDALVP